MAKYTLVRNGDNKALKTGNKTIATWDKHDAYEDVVASIMDQRIGEDDELVEKDETAEPAPEPTPEVADEG